MPARVRALSTRFPHWGRHSGIGQFLKHLDPRRVEVETYLASDGNQDFPIRSPRLRDLLQRRVQRRGMKWYKLSDLIAEERALVRRLRGGFEILHYLDGEHGAQYLPFLRSLLRTALVATYHQPARLLPSLLRPEVVRRLDQVTLLSPEQVPFFRELLPPERISVILHGIDTEFFRPSPERANGRDFSCIAVGHWLRDYDALRKTAELFQSSERIRFRVVTPKPVGLESCSNLEVHQNVSDEELRALYQSSDLLFLPLSDCTANNAVLEALACGLPVVSTELPSLRAYLPGEEAILVPRNDPRALADAIASLRGDRALRERMSRAARKRAEELDWPRVAKRYESLYLSLAGKASGRGGRPD